MNSLELQLIDIVTLSIYIGCTMLAEHLAENFNMMVNMAQTGSH